MQPQLQHILATLPDGQYKVITTLDAEAHIYAEKHLSEHVVRHQQRDSPVTQGSLVTMRPDGAVAVMMGGIGNTLEARGTNRAKATQGRIPRPPASSFKPIIYLAALEKGLKPNSIINAQHLSPFRGGGRCQVEHERFSLCYSHYEDKHGGPWESCQKCRAFWSPRDYQRYAENPINWPRY